MNITIEKGAWETDFLLKEILPQGNVIEVETKDLENYNQLCDAIAFSSRVHSFWNIRDLCLKIKPKIIIQLSDEFYQENKWEYNLLGNYCDLFLRNYHHSYYNYTDNTEVIPLGYTNSCIQLQSEKLYDWSFIGELKNDRVEMLNIFSQLSNHYVNNHMSKPDMCKIYSQSIFVPCGRGNSSLECFRLYEASMNGAIPIIVGEESEIKCTFKYKQNPPWIFASTWNEALEKCVYLLNNKNQLSIQQENLSNWWYNRINYIKNKVLEVL